MPPNPSVNYSGLSNRTRGNVDRSIASLSGSSQALVPASEALRKRLIFKNGAAAAVLNLKGGTAVAGGANCVTLQPYEGLALYGQDCPKDAITVIGTSANYFNCLEGF